MNGILKINFKIIFISVLRSYEPQSFKNQVFSGGRMKGTIFLFGAAEKGAACQPISLHSLDELFAQLGHPPDGSEGIRYGIQTLLFQHSLIFFRVGEEGFSYGDYMLGFRWLKKTPIQPHLSAICLPGVGDEELIQGATSVCLKHQCSLIISEKDLYDYLTVK